MQKVGQSGQKPQAEPKSGGSLDRAAWLPDTDILRVEKNVEKISGFAKIMLDEQQGDVTIEFMIIEEIRKQITRSGKSRYRIAQDTGIDEAALCRIIQGGSCKVETADILLKYFGLTIASKGKKKAR